MVHSASGDLGGNVQCSAMPVAPVANDADLDQLIEARFAIEAASIKRDLEAMAMELGGAKRCAALEEQLNVLTGGTAALEEANRSSKAELKRLTDLIEPLERAAANFFAQAAHPYGADAFAAWTQPPPFCSTPFDGPPTEWSRQMGGFAFMPEIGCTKPNQVVSDNEAVPAPTIPCDVGQVKHATVADDALRFRTCVSEPCSAAEVPASPKTTMRQEILSPNLGPCASPKLSPGRAAFSVMDMFGQEVPARLPQSEPAARTLKSRTTQGRLTPQPYDARRSAWSLMGSPTPARSPAQKRTTWPGLMQSPVPASPFVIMEDGGTSFSFALRKADGVELGLDATYTEASSGLMVRNVLPGGAIEAWNRQCAGGPAAGKAVNAGDCITSVNGIKDVKAMLQECQTKALLRFTVTRAGVAASEDEEECDDDTSIHSRSLTAPAAMPPFAVDYSSSNLDAPPGLGPAPPVEFGDDPPPGL